MAGAALKYPLMVTAKAGFFGMRNSVNVFVHDMT
jgi:hypothetical protein